MQTASGKWGSKQKNRSQRYDINKPSPRHGHKYTKYKMYLSIMMVIFKQHLTTFEAQFMKKLSNTDAELKKKSVAFKKSVYYEWLYSWNSGTFCI